MTSLSETILEQYQVRKSRKQKDAFIALLRSHFPSLQVEKAGPFGSRNLILGDLDRAKVVLTAHYDTCALFPFPNFLTPQNIPLYILYNLLICVPLFAVTFAVSFLVSDPLLCFVLVEGTVVLFLWSLLFGIPNNHTANDNTSGVITLLEIYAGLPENQKDQVCFVFFDHEELGLLGSSAFRKLHKEKMKVTPLLNFDCVSDGAHFLLVRSKACGDSLDQHLTAAFVADETHSAALASTSNTIYPSDQAGFPLGVGIASFHRHPIVGLYMNKIHTSKDRVFDRGNIAFIQGCAQTFLNRITE